MNTPWRTARKLAEFGLLGINQRNAGYTLSCNPRELFPLVDDKLKTKRLCQQAGIPTAKLLAVARRVGDLSKMMEQLAAYDSFVLKPARGAMGNGIVVIVARDGDRMQRPGGGWMTDEQFRYHASGILSGLYALGGQPDVAFVEEKLDVHPELAAICRGGVPDYRVIIYRGVPVMAMARLPTSESGGRANLHHGAVGIGIDLATGISTHAVIRSTPTRLHPDTKELVVNRPIPDFDRALEIAVAVGDLTGLGYVGADIVVDAHRGPVVLEMNARPGLAIQIANRSGLRPRLNAVDAAYREGMPLADRVALGREIARKQEQTRART